MHIEHIRINGLFGLFDHNLRFRPDEHIIIMIGPNGTGKTMTLRLIDMLFNQPLSRLSSMPFKKIEVSFDDDSCLLVERDTEPEEQATKRAPITVIYTQSQGESPHTFRPTEFDIDHEKIDFLISEIDHFIPVLRRIGPREWRDLRTEHVLDLEDVLVDFRDELPHSLRKLYPDSPKWMQEVRDSIAVRFIDTERLTGGRVRSTRSRARFPRRIRRTSSEDNSRRTVHIYSEELADLVSNSIREYGTLSQSLDRTFPRRLVAEKRTSDSSKENLRQDLSEIEDRRFQLEEAGLLVQEHAAIEIPDLDSVDESRLGVLAVYADDTKQKLRVFDELYDRVNALKKKQTQDFVISKLPWIARASVFALAPESVLT